MEDRGMRMRIGIVFFLLCGLCCSAGPGLAGEADIAAIVSNQELAATVTGASVTIALHTELQNARTGTGDIAGSQFQNFLGIQTVSANTGQGAISQAATSLAIRATLTMSGVARLGF
jgi:hypothetical protein